MTRTLDTLRAAFARLDWSVVSQRLGEVLAHPGEQPIVALMLFGAFVLMLAIVVLLALIAFSGRRPRLRPRRTRRPAATRPTRAPGTAGGLPPGARRVRSRAGGRRVVVRRRVAAVPGHAPGTVPARVAVPSPGVSLAAPAKRAAKRRRARTPQQRARAARIALWVDVLLVAAAIVVLYGGTSLDSYCMKLCHANGALAVRRSAADHPHVACIACHEDPLPLGLLGNAAQRTRYVAARLEGRTTVQTADVPSSRCLRCHGDLDRHASTREPSIRMSHAEPLAAGMACTDCHADAGHGTGTERIGMSRCVTCHDGSAASAKCSTCHRTDPDKTYAEERYFDKVPARQVTDCGGCHPQTTCDACHGVRLPHSAAFIAQGHAKVAAFGGKKTCYRCHTESMCSRCHLTPFEGGHPKNWITAHQAEPKTAGCNCHAVKSAGGDYGGKKSFCAVCH